MRMACVKSMARMVSPPLVLHPTCRQDLHQGVQMGFCGIDIVHILISQFSN